MNISNQSCAIYKLRNIVSTPISVNTDDKHGDANTIRGDVHDCTKIDNNSFDEAALLNFFNMKLSTADTLLTETYSFELLNPESTNVLRQQRLRST